MSAALAASALAAALLLWVPPDAARRARVRSLAGPRRDRSAGCAG
ncbi:hypothetical protein JD78_04137 [Modestobacter roseus]|uniref:Uncharacterized protein n=1 Tax=Modestobacter roseus TaxID=1181884 RepID=A0A562IY92_9ACTN|nr:hypothetical protein [Modestobacter roseus]TWH75575.1 hypothetical protein JD78_04137 [Modestobacter roseus]